jgi:hypothetical protein
VLHRAAYAALGLTCMKDGVVCRAEPVPDGLAARRDWAGFW